jgi:hypothetical protein
METPGPTWGGGQSQEADTADEDLFLSLCH